MDIVSAAVLAACFTVTVSADTPAEVGVWVLLVSGKEEAMQGQGPLYRNQAA